MRVRGLGDGPRDEAMMPGILETLLKVKLSVEFTAWRQLRFSGGYAAKLRFVMLQARDAGDDGVVAWADEDTHGKNSLRDLRAAREQDNRKHLPVPTASGFAVPHAEAWLLDDPVAIRDVLQVDAGAIPTVRNSASPKTALDELHRNSPRAEEALMRLLPHLAAALEPARCQHGHETGWDGFQKDVHQQFGERGNG